MLELKIPPLALVALFAGAMLAIAAAAPGLGIVLPGARLVAGALALAGSGLAAAGVVAFRRHETTVDPRCPEASSAIVSTGIYGLTRNPMYLGFLLWLAALAAMLGNLAAMLLLPAFVLYMNRYQIEPEERALLAKFGEPFAQYKASVRRWA